MNFKKNQIIKIKKNNIIGIIDYIDEEPLTANVEQSYRVRVYNNKSKKYTLWCYESELEKIDAFIPDSVYAELDLLEIHYGKVSDKIYKKYQKKITNNPKNKEEYDNLLESKLINLNRKILEIRTHLKLCNTYEQKIKVLKKYNIINFFTLKVKWKDEN